MTATIKRKTWTWREAKSLVGSLVFASFVVPLGLLLCRDIQIAANKLSMWLPNQKEHIPKKVTTELEWWMLNVGCPSKIFPQNPTVFMSTDASDLGWGANMGETSMSAPWELFQKTWHINLKELFAVREAVRKNSRALKGQGLMIQSDNRTVLSYLRRQGGTKSKALLNMTKDILNMCHQASITIHPQFVPGTYNLIADSLSRSKLVPEWCLSRVMVQRIFSKWGTPQIDLFASQASAVVETYVSLDRTEKTALFINAFNRNWNFKLAWISSQLRFLGSCNTGT